MKILLVSPVHPWDDVRIFHKEAKSLAKNGFDVSVLARSDKARTEDKVKIIPVKALYKNRLLRFLSIFFITYQVLSIKADVYHLHNPDTLPIALVLKIFGKKFVYDTHEDFLLRINAREWIPKILRSSLAKFISNLEIFVSHLSNGAIATQPDVVQRLGKKAILIGNQPRVNHEIFSIVESYSSKIDKDPSVLRLVYIGGIAKIRGLNEMIDSLTIINNKISCRLWLIGPTFDGVIEDAKRLEGWKYVDYIARLPQEEAFAYVEKSDIGLIYIHDSADHRKSDPNKLYEYMSFSKPFIASNFESWVEKFGNINAGIFIPPNNTAELANAVLTLAQYSKDEINILGTNGFQFVEKNNWDKEFLNLLVLYKSIK